MTIISYFLKLDNQDLYSVNKAIIKTTKQRSGLPYCAQIFAPVQVVCIFTTFHHYVLARPSATMPAYAIIIEYFFDPC